VVLVFDVGRLPFSNPQVRQAFALATDREALANVAMGGYFSQATGGLVPPGMPGHVAGMGLPYHPRQARQLLAEAGYPGGRGFPTVDCLAWNLLEAPLKFLQMHWQDSLEIEIRGEAPDSGIYTERRLAAQPPHISIQVWVADYPDPHNFLSEGLAQTGTTWQNQAYDGLIARAGRIRDQAERVRLYEQAEGILAEEVPIVPLLHPRWDMLVKPWLSRYPVSPMDYWFWKDVIIEPHQGPSIVADPCVCSYCLSRARRSRCPRRRSCAVYPSLRACRTRSWRTYSAAWGGVLLPKVWSSSTR
jgi:oligopeptide transport system substrate-binding protein